MSDSFQHARNIEDLEDEKKPFCELCGDTGEVDVDECTCGGIDIGVGEMHFPECGKEQCPNGCKPK